MRRSLSVTSRSTTWPVMRSGRTGRDLLNGPAVAVRVAEEHKRTPWELLHLADLHPAPDELGTSGVDIGDHQLQSLRRARRHLAEALSDRDGARRPRGRELHEPEVIRDYLVVVGDETGLVRVEGLGPVHIRDRDLDQFELPIHLGLLPSPDPSHAVDVGERAATDP